MSDLVGTPKCWFSHAQAHLYECNLHMLQLHPAVSFIILPVQHAGNKGEN